MASDLNPDSTQDMLKDYHRKVKRNIERMRNNYKEILISVEQSLESAKPKEPKETSKNKNNKSRQEAAVYASQTGHDEMQIQIKAANIVRAAHELLDLTSDLKTLVIISDLSSTHSAKEMSVKNHTDKSEQILRGMLRMKDDISADLFDIEEEVYQTRI